MKDTPTEAALLEVLGINAPAREMTARKTAFVLTRDKSMITGFVITDPAGNIGIVDKSATQWLAKHEFRQLMHGDVTPLIRAAESMDGLTAVPSTPIVQQQ